MCNFALHVMTDPFFLNET